MIKGKKGCDEYSKWVIKIKLVDEEYIKLGEQLTEKDAKEMYDNLKKDIQDTKSEWIEVEFDGDCEKEINLINKRNIISIDMY